jgi:hypothetical protein
VATRDSISKRDAALLSGGAASSLLIAKLLRGRRGRAPLRATTRTAPRLTTSQGSKATAPPRQARTKKTRHTLASERKENAKILADYQKQNEALKTKRKQDEFFKRARSKRTGQAAAWKRKRRAGGMTRQKPKVRERRPEFEDLRRWAINERDTDFNVLRRAAQHYYNFADGRPRNRQGQFDPTGAPFSPEQAKSAYQSPQRKRLKKALRQRQATTHTQPSVATV